MTTERTLRVVVAEDNALLRQGIARLLSEHPDVASVVEAATLPELLEVVGSAPPDIVLTDLRMPPRHATEGIEAARLWRRTHPDLGVIVLSQFADPESALELVAEGSSRRGYLLKERIADVDQLVAALRSVAAGGSVIDAEVVDGLLAHRRREDSPVARLTPRETEVLAAIATGASNSAIAEELFITSRAVEKHINSIFTKLDLPQGDQTHRRVAAVLLFLSESGGHTLGSADQD